MCIEEGAGGVSSMSTTLWLVEEGGDWEEAVWEEAVWEEGGGDWEEGGGDWEEEVWEEGCGCFLVWIEV